MPSVYQFIKETYFDIPGDDNNITDALKNRQIVLDQRHFVKPTVPEAVNSVRNKLGFSKRISCSTQTFSYWSLFDYPKHQYRKLYFNVFRKMGTPGEEDFLGVDKPKYENKRDRNRNRHRIGNWGTVETINITMLSLPTRGSKKSVTLKVPLLTPGDTRVSFIKS